MLPSSSFEARLGTWKLRSLGRLPEGDARPFSACGARPRSASSFRPATLHRDSRTRSLTVRSIAHPPTWLN